MDELEDKKEGFAVPEGYFDNFQERLMHRIEAVSEEHDLPKEDGFVVPEDYFDQLQQQLSQKISEPESKVIPLRPYRKYYLAAAAIAAIIVTVVGLNWESQEPLTFQDIASSEIDIYFENHDVGLSPSEIAEVLPLEDVDMDDFMKASLEEENIVDYIDENIDDFEELNLEDDEIY